MLDALLCEQVYRFQVPRVRYIHYYLLRARLFDLKQALPDTVGRADQRLLADTMRRNITRERTTLSKRRFVGLCNCAVEQHCAPDSVVIASNVFAMLFDDGELPLKSFEVEVTDIAGVTILRDQFECDLLAASTNKQGYVRLLHAFRPVDRAMYLVVFALKYGLVIRPHFQDNLHRVAQLAQACRPIGKIVPESVKLVLVPASADAKIEPPMR